MQDLQLTEHFKLSEFTRSATATRLGINNSLDPSDSCSKVKIDNLRSLCEHVLEPLRAYANSCPLREGREGSVPIIIGSGYRCPKLNSAVGGVKNSNHLYGYAADIHLPSISLGKEWFTWMMDNLQFDELIWETANRKSYWIHVAFKPTGNRQKVVTYLLKSNAKSR